MIEYYYGPDAYRRRAAVIARRDAFYTSFPDGSWRVFDGEEKDALINLERFLATPGLFAKRSCALVLHPEELGRPLHTALKRYSEDAGVLIILSTEKKLPVSEFGIFKNPSKQITVEEFSSLVESAFEKLLADEAKKLHLPITTAQVRLVAQTYEGDTWRAMTELEHLAFGGSLATPGVQEDFQATILNFIGSDIGRRLRSLFLFLRDDDPAKTFNIAAAWMRGAAKIRMADYDLAIKSGKLEYDDALLDAAIREL